MTVHLRVAVAKAPKFGLRDSGDTAEVAERPRGGMSIVLADGQGHGRAAKRISALVVSKALSLVADGGRDGAVARVVHDYLFALRDGKVSATLTMISADLATGTLVVSRNSHCPVLIKRNGRTSVLTKATEPIGVHRWMKPAIDEWPLAAGTVVVTFTDGILAAGQRYGTPLDLKRLRKLVSQASPEHVDAVAEEALAYAMACDQGRPSDDMTVVAVGLAAAETDLGTVPVRRMQVSLPL